MLSPWHRRAVPLFACLGLVMMGCGVRTYPVEGKVVFKDGTLLTAGVVEFESVVPPHTRAAGRLDREGHFVLNTTHAGSGAMTGEYRMRILPELPERFELLLDPDPTRARALLIDGRYLDFDTSGLKVAITPGRNDLTISIARPAE
jgi:hypothetical protein